jgi:preprotein translocase subunit SecB
MEVKNQAKLLFHSVDIVESQLQVKRSFNFESEIHLETTAELIQPTADGQFRIVMRVVMSVVDYFNLSVKGCGHFQLVDNELQGEQEAKQFIHNNAPAIMFPYIRAFITTLSAQTGQSLPPLVIPTQFFQGELSEMDVKSSANMPTFNNK